MTCSHALRDHLSKLRFILDDLTKIDEHALRARPLTPQTRVTLFLLQRAPGSIKILHELRSSWSGDIHIILTQSGGAATYSAMLRYILAVAPKDLPVDDFRDFSVSLGPDAEEVYMTVADKLRAEGEARGRAEMLLEQLTQRFGSLSPAMLSAVRGASVEALTAWAGRVLAANTVDEVLARP